MSNSIEVIGGWLRESQCALAFTGAGISTESGIPDFRSPGGIWANSTPVMFDDFMADATARHEYWRQKAISHRDFSNSQPNAGHRVLADWEESGLLQRVITQNIDGLHQMAGSREVVELHGTAREIMCMDCEARFDADEMVELFLKQDVVPPCPSCGDGRLKHATISFGQALDPDVIGTALTLAQSCDLMFAMGSSLVVEPAASIPRIVQEHGGKLVIINRDSTPQDMAADAVLHAPIGATLTAIDESRRA